MKTIGGMKLDSGGKLKGITFSLALMECFLRAPTSRAFEELAANFTCNNIRSFESGRITLSKAVAAVVLLILAKANLGFISPVDGQFGLTLMNSEGVRFVLATTPSHVSAPPKSKWHDDQTQNK